MKKTLEHGLTLIAIITLTSCCKPPVELKKPEWETYTSDEAGFSILMPGEVEESSELMATDAGMIEIHYFTVDKGYGAFMVSYNYLPFAEDAEFTESDIEQFFTDSQNGSLETFPEGKIIYEKKISLDGHPGREYQLRGKNGELDAQFSARIYLVDGTKFFQVGVASTPTGVSAEDIKKFQDSFKLL